MTPTAKRTYTATLPDKGVYSVGAVAKICKVACRTVSKWFDAGKFAGGYRLPDSQDRRIPADALLMFLKDHGFPLPPELAPKPKLLRKTRAKREPLLPIKLAVCLPEHEADKLYDWLDADVFGAGLTSASRTIEAALIGDAAGLDTAVRVATSIVGAHPKARVVLLVSEDAPQAIPGWAGKVVRRPVDLAAVAAELTEGK